MTLPSYIGLAIHYHPLLTRYARRILQNDEAASAMAIKALLHLWIKKEEAIVTGKLRQFLIVATKTNCHNWLHCQLQKQIDKPKNPG